MRQKVLQSRVCHTNTICTATPTMTARQPAGHRSATKILRKAVLTMSGGSDGGILGALGHPALLLLSWVSLLFGENVRDAAVFPVAFVCFSWLRCKRHDECTQNSSAYARRCIACVAKAAASSGSSCRRSTCSAACFPKVPSVREFSTLQRSKSNRTT